MTTPWRSSGSLNYHIFSCVLPKYTLNDCSVELNCVQTRLPAHLREPVCHSLARNNGCSNIFRGYCCQTRKLAHNYRLSSIAFPYFMTKRLCHSSFCSTTAQTVIFLLFQKSNLCSLVLQLETLIISFVCSGLLYSFICYALSSF